MSVRVHVSRGTTNSSKDPLCFTCRSATVATDERGRKLITCQEFGRVYTKIVECTSYLDKAKPDKWEFERLAWVLQTDKNRGPIGFAPPTRRTDEL